MKKFASLLTEQENAIPRFIAELKRRNKSVILYGAGYCGKETLALLRENHIPVAAVCDDFHIGEYMDDIKIVDISQIQVNDNIMIIITSGFNKLMKERLFSLGYKENYVEIDFGRYDSVRENKQYFTDNAESFIAAYNLLSDEKSKDIFLRLVNYRISRNLEFLDGIMEETPQYYPREPWFNLRGGGGYLDLGAYNGDTVQAYLDYVRGQYTQIIAVDASKKNFTALKENLKNIKSVEFHNLAVADRRKILSMVSGVGNISFVSDQGDVLVQADSVDNILQGRDVDFIKMDIEGAEFDAIVGMRDTLQKYKPTLAISVYHLVDDLFRLELMIEKYCKNQYNYYLRHYSPTVTETVLYAIPQ